MKKEFVRNPYNYDSDELSEETGLECKDESLTDQEHVQEADINYIAERFMRTGEVPHVLHLPTSGDFDGIFDFQSAMNVVATAKREFMELPAKIRNRFENDPAQLLDFVNKEENREEAERLGIIEKRATIQPPPTTGVTNEPTTQGTTDGTPQKEPRTRGTKADAKPDA